MKKKKPPYEGKMYLKKDDEVVVLSGKDKGKRGTVKQTMPDEGKVVVEGVNIVTRHQKPRSTSGRAMVKQQLGEIQMPMGVPVGKVMLVCPKCNRETKVAKAESPGGDHVRKCRKCGNLLDG